MVYIILARLLYSTIIKGIFHLSLETNIIWFSLRVFPCLNCNDGILKWDLKILLNIPKYTDFTISKMMKYHFCKIISVENCSPNDLQKKCIFLSIMNAYFGDNNCVS